MSETFSARKYMKEVNEILKEAGAQQLVEIPEPVYEKCPNCEGEWFFSAARIPKGDLTHFALNIEQQFICVNCKTVVPINFDGAVEEK